MTQKPRGREIEIALEMNNATGAIPNCPITGLPARRRIQPISGRLIIELWRRAFGVSTDRQIGGIDHFGLWESPCGLAFFDPMLPGDEAFYLDLYRRADFHRALNAPGLARAEFRRIAEMLRPGEKILDVGCGEAGLARHLPDAIYVGLEPHCYAPAAAADIRNETIAKHAASHAEEYDLVCAFHAIEHVPDPLGFARDLVRCLKFEGRLCIVVPSRDSAITKIPNFVLNAPPHHLSWWNESALRALASRLDLATEAIEAVPFSFDSIIYWMARYA
jgi:SAM-dependent methyltransferase